MIESAEGPIHFTAVTISLATHSLLNGTYSDLSRTYPKVSKGTGSFQHCMFGLGVSSEATKLYYLY